MNYNIVFKLTKDTIIISQIKKDVNQENLNNTNIIDVKDLKFSIDYIKENFELVSNFLNVIIIKKNIENVQIMNMDIALLILDLVNTWEHINKVIFKPDKSLTLDIILKLLDNNYLKTIECYDINNYLLDRLVMNKNIKVKTRHKYDLESEFMKTNLLSSYSEIFYKKMVIITKDFDDNDIRDFQNFIALNNNLKTIKIVKYSNEILTLVIDEIIKNKRSNIKIEITEKNNELNVIFNTVNYIKKKYHKYFDKNNIKFKLTYSKEYKKNNFFKQINFKLFTSILVFVVLVSMISVSIDTYIQYKDQNKIDEELSEIDNILDRFEIVSDIDNNVNDINIIDKGTLITTKPKSPSVYYTNFDGVFKTLLDKNKDTVGWLEVKNTKIKYPVVQADVNSYYSGRDFNKKKNKMGWIFMDYRNNPTNLDKNTIIYGHNIKSGIMFGTIKYIFNSSWYKKDSNRLITFNTPTKNMKWEIFSIYQIDVTEDYLQNEFTSDDEFMKFIDMIKARSIAKFDVDINKDSKILTLSTCGKTSEVRQVVHAVLIEE